MNEILKYHTLDSGRKILLHYYLPMKSKRILYLFFDSFFDERHKCSHFLTRTARRFCRADVTVIRFDYFGTGDSDGEFPEFDILKNVQDVHSLIAYFKKDFGDYELRFLGIRMGADQAILAANSLDLAQKIIAIEPVVYGKNFLLELNLKREAFKITLKDTYPLKTKWNSRDDVEDFQGYLISEKTVSDLRKLDLTKLQIKNKSLALIKINFPLSNRNVTALSKSLSQDNLIYFNNVDCVEFWSRPMIIDTHHLEEKVTSCFSNSS